MSNACVLRLLRISRTVSDLGRAVEFYRDALNFRLVEAVTRVDNAWGELMGIPGARGQTVMMRLGEQELELVAFDPPGKPYPPESSSVDQWFQHIAIVVGDIDIAYAKLRAYPYKSISARGPQRLPPTSGSVTAFKFRDPDGHPVELIHFPSSADIVQYEPELALFRGIDHSAIDIADMEQSLDFYTRLLGMRVASRSINFGPAQMRLDHERDVRVNVVALQPTMAATPHVELLGYERPRGRPIPADLQSNDVVADRFVFQVHNLTRLVEIFESENVAFISPGCVKLCADQYGVQICDPTGHRLILMEKNNCV